MAARGTGTAHPDEIEILEEWGSLFLCVEKETDLEIPLRIAFGSDSRSGQIGTAH